MLLSISVLFVGLITITHVCVHVQVVRVHIICFVMFVDDHQFWLILHWFIALSRLELDELHHILTFHWLTAYICECCHTHVGLSIVIFELINASSVCDVFATVILVSTILLVDSALEYCNTCGAVLLDKVNHQFCAEHWLTVLHVVVPVKLMVHVIHIIWEYTIEFQAAPVAEKVACHLSIREESFTESVIQGVNALDVICHRLLR